jgi:hypothetical protein
MSDHEQQKHEHKNLPIAPGGDGYDIDDAGQHSVATFIKWSAESSWTKDGEPIDPGTTFAAVAVGHSLTHWENERVVEEIDTHPLPDIDALNSAVPEDKWEEGFNGEPREPWSHTYKVYLLNTTTGERSVYATSTIGGRITWERTVDKVRWIRRTRHQNVVPRVVLDAAKMRTRFGVKLRPDIRIVDWLDLSGAPVAEAPQLPKVEEPSIREDLNDEIPH